MVLDEILASLFPSGCGLRSVDGIAAGEGKLPDGRTVNVLVISETIPLGIDGAIRMAGHVLDIVRRPGTAPILMLVDSSSQRMSRRDELLGLSEYLAHLAKALLLAEREGHRTIGLIYGGSAAGAFIASALATSVLVALPGAHPLVMDLASMARVTKLLLDDLRAKAATTPVFAPGLDNLARMGAVHAVWDPEASLADQLVDLLSQPPHVDLRDELGLARGGRPMAARVAQEVMSRATSGHG